MEKLKRHSFRKDDKINSKKNKHCLYTAKKRYNSTNDTLQEEAQLKRLDKMFRRKKRDSRMNLY
ncbi:hypothetical protein [Tenacibaculum xiamenense]|uniref:hypothetical protein n=1 Tax=Tenacibaculum xiamenense TaxID=1261553 RepID=UPI003892EAC8